MSKYSAYSNLIIDILLILTHRYKAYFNLIIDILLILTYTDGCIIKVTFTLYTYRLDKSL